MQSNTVVLLFPYEKINFIPNNFFVPFGLQTNKCNLQENIWLNPLMPEFFLSQFFGT